MQDIQVPGQFIYSGLTGSGTVINGLVPVSTNSLSCDDIQTALNSYNSPTSYPVDCDFTTLNNTGVVFFMDPITEQLVTSIEVYSGGNSTQGFSKDNIDFIYSVETGFICVLILCVGFYRQLRKLSPYLLS